jgi:tetratricopeptide (TPR) repeat protein
LAPGIREDLSALLAELGTLAGWQALDLGDISRSWQYYEQAKAAARESGQPDFEAHTAAEQAFVLIDLGETVAAVRLLATINKHARRATGRLLRSWLAAAYGEALAADGQRSASLRAFDRAASLLPAEPSGIEGPYVALDVVHLERWRGHALARIGEPDAIDVLTSALDRIDPTFTRAETGLRVDLATAFVAIGERDEAMRHIAQAHALATDIGSVRQQRRLLQLQQ